MVFVDTVAESVKGGGGRGWMCGRMRCENLQGVRRSKEGTLFCRAHKSSLLATFLSVYHPKNQFAGTIATRITDFIIIVIMVFVFIVIIVINIVLSVLRACLSPSPYRVYSMPNEVNQYDIK